MKNILYILIALLILSACSSEPTPTPQATLDPTYIQLELEVVPVEDQIMKICEANISDAFEYVGMTTLEEAGSYSYYWASDTISLTVVGYQDSWATAECIFATNEAGETVLVLID